MEECKMCGIKNTGHSEKTKTELSLRLKKIEGQIRGVAKMIDDNIYCDDVLNQITSVEAALNGVRKILLEEHIKTCVTEQLLEGKTEVVDELIKTIGRMIK